MHLFGGGTSARRERLSCSVWLVGHACCSFSVCSAVVSYESVRGSNSRRLEGVSCRFMEWAGQAHCVQSVNTHTLFELNSVRYHVASCKMFSCPPPVLSVICWSLRDSREALTLATRTAQQCRDVSCDRCGVASTTIAEHGTNLLTDRTCVRYAGFLRATLG